jgi:membrane dipeptidase
VTVLIPTEDSDPVPFINGLTMFPCAPGEETLEWGLREFAAVMAAGSVTAVNLTVAVNEDFESALARIGALQRILDNASPTEIRLVRSVDDLLRAAAAGTASVIIGFQNTAALEPDIELVVPLYAAGLRIIQLTYQKMNDFGSGCGEAVDRGLTARGRKLVRRLNETGITIDLSHCGDRTSYEAIDASEVPVVISHANLRTHLDHPRNKDDRLLVALGERGGIVGLSAVSRYIRNDGAKATFAEFLNQVSYLADLVGVNAVAIGLDVTEGQTDAVIAREKAPLFAQYPELTLEIPTAEDYYVEGLESVAGFTVIRDGLKARGFSPAEAAAILGGNWLRVLRETWGTAAEDNQPTATEEVSLD